MVEDFTFPSVPPEQCKKLSFPHFASPPPWFIVDTAAAAAAHDHRRCFSAVEHGGKADDDGDGSGYFYHGSGRSFAAVVVEEHKMDMLWEDFNEELARAAPPPCPLSKEWASEAWLAGDGGAGTLPLSRHVATVASGSVVRRRRLSLLTMLKLLKKLFLARKTKAATSSSRKAPAI